MFENVAITAAIISAITALTTSLRALGRSRETHHAETTQKRNIRLHLLVTIIWVALSIALFSLLWVQPEHSIHILPWVSLYLVLIIILFFVWHRVLQRKN